MTTRIATTASFVKNVALFAAAPFIALVYIIALPFVGLGLLVVMGARAAARNEVGKAIGRIARIAAIVLATPVVTLTTVVLFPFVGLLTLVVIGGRALLKDTHMSYELCPTTA
jgi:hypothetical protein